MSINGINSVNAGYSYYPEQHGYGATRLPSASTGGQDTYFGATPKKKTSWFKRLLKLSMAAAGAFVGVLAFQQFAPAAALKVAQYIPGIVKNGFNQVAGSRVGLWAKSHVDQLLDMSQGLLNALKGSSEAAEKNGPELTIKKAASETTEAAGSGASTPIQSESKQDQLNRLYGGIRNQR